jgi:hypothetical protein
LNPKWFIVFIRKGILDIASGKEVAALSVHVAGFVMRLNRKSHAKRIGVELRGGLGNQLFQLAALEHTVKRENAYPKIDLSRISVGQFPRKFEISHELLKRLFQEEPLIISKKGFSLFFMKIIWRVESLHPFFKFPFRHYATDLGLDASLGNTVCKKMLVGYFQTFYYAQSLEWHKKFKKIGIENIEYHFLIREMKKSKPTAMHIRGGDYLLDKSGIGNLDIDYYRESLFESESLKDLIWIFTDDIEYARQIAFDCNIDYKIVDEQRLLTPLETLLLMSHANKMIISNSTFAWWAAFLSKTAKIYAPSKWFQKMQDPVKLFPDHWHLTESIWK